MSLNDENSTFVEFGTIDKYQIYKVPVPQTDNKAINFWVVVPKGISPRYKNVHHKLSLALAEFNL